MKCGWKQELKKLRAHEGSEAALGMRHYPWATGTLMRSRSLAESYRPKNVKKQKKRDLATINKTMHRHTGKNIRACRLQAKWAVGNLQLLWEVFAATVALGEVGDSHCFQGECHPWTPTGQWAMVQ